MTLRVTLAIAKGEFEEHMTRFIKPLAVAATKTMDETLLTVKSEGRADIAQAGFSKKWQNTLRLLRFPKRGASLNAAVFIYHKIPFAGIFETGGKIKGSPLLWLRLPTTPKKIGRNRMTPKNFERLIGGLVPIRGARVPLLGAPVRLSNRQANSDRPKPTLAALKRGTSGEKGRVRVVPLFFGARSVKIRDKFSITEIIEKAQQRLPRLFAENFNKDND